MMAQPPDGCSPLQIQISGYGVVMNRGGCTFTTKAENAQSAGAVFVIVVQMDVSSTGSPFCLDPPCEAITMTSGTSWDPRAVTIPAFMIGSVDGADLKKAISAKDPVQVQFPAFKPGDYQSVNLASFSSRGPTSDGRLKPDVICPGDSIVSACSDGDTSSFDCASFIAEMRFAGKQGFSTSNGSAVTQMSGTSMATPACAGAATMVRQYFRRGFWHMGMRQDNMSYHPTASLVKAVLINGAQPLWYRDTIASEQGSAESQDRYNGPREYGAWIAPTKKPSPEQGYGLINLDASLWFNSSGGSQIFRDGDNGLSKGHQAQVYFKVVPGEETDVRVTLVWSDPPATPFASVALINNLDLRVRGPDQGFAYGNAHESYDNDGQKLVMLDDINNSEQVWLQKAPAGNYVVQVLAALVPQGPQNFSLVIRGNIKESPESQFTQRNDFLNDCPASCSGHGECNTKTMACMCSKWWIGPDCSYRYEATPHQCYTLNHNCCLA